MFAIFNQILCMEKLSITNQDINRQQRDDVYKPAVPDIGNNYKTF